MLPLPGRRRGLLGLFAFALLALPSAAAADTPPTPDCTYKVAGVCDPLYGSAPATTRTVEVDEEFDLSSGLEPPIPYTQPILPNCGPGSTATCIYWSLGWLVQPSAGPSPVQQLSGCTANTPTCRIRYSPRAIGDAGDFYTPIVASLNRGQTPNTQKAWFIYARPRFRRVGVTGTGGIDYPARNAYAVRGGTNPTYAQCIDGATINATSPTTGYNCVRVAGVRTTGQNPTWSFVLPAQSGTWDLIMDPVQRTESGPTRVAGHRWQTRAVTVTNNDIAQTVAATPRGTLTAAIDLGGPTIQMGTSRIIKVTGTAVGGVVDRAEFVGQVAGKTGSAIDRLDYLDDTKGTLLPGETIVGRMTMKAASFIPSVPTSTVSAKVWWASPTSPFSDTSVNAPPATITVVRDPVPPPPPGGGGAVPKPPIPTAATTAGVTGRVADQPLTSYIVTWFSAASCGAEDATSRLIGTKTVTTDGAGDGDASVSPAASADGEAVFGYSTLNGVRSNRSECVTTATPQAPPAGAGPLVPIAGAVLPAAKPPTLKLTLPKGGVRKGRRVSLKVAVGGATGGTVVLRNGKKKLASGKVVKGVATLKVKLTKKGKLKLTLVYTPAGGGTPTTKAITLRVT